MQVCRLSTEIDQLIARGVHQQVAFPSPPAGDDPQRMHSARRMPGVVWPSAAGDAIVSAVAVWEEGAGYDTLSAVLLADPHLPAPRVLKRARTVTARSDCPCVTLIARVPLTVGQSIGLAVSHDAAGPAALVGAELRVAIFSPRYRRRLPHHPHTRTSQLIS